jgi:hypothetical protein
MEHDGGMSHWRSGWKLWPDRPKGPVGSDYQQVDWIRPYRPGYLRVFASAVGLVVFFIPFLMSIIVFLASTGSLIARFLVSLSLALIATGFLILVGRLFAAGVYVNDFGLRVVTITSMRTWMWDQIADVSTAPGKAPCLGINVVPVRANVVYATTVELGPHPTPVTSVSLDFLGRAEAFDAAALAIERWWRDAGSVVSG